MRVALVSREYPPHVYGGAGVHVQYLARELARLTEVTVHCFGEQSDLQGRPRVAGHQPWTAISQGPPTKYRAALETLSVDLEVVQALHDAELVHTHTWYAAMAGYWAKILYGIPLVLTTHSLEPLRAWKAEQLGNGYRLSSWMERTAIEAADAIVAVSNGTRADVLSAYPAVSPARVHVIHNGIDLDEFRKTEETGALVEFGLDLQRPYVLFVGRVTRQKGVTHLADAIRYLPVETQVVLCAGAPDTEEIAAELRAKVTALQRTHPNVIWIERMVNKPELIQLYSHAAVFCCPSVYEPFGIINLEAMACETAVVASATGGIREVVVEGETGYLVPFAADNVTHMPLDSERFARDLGEKLARLLASPDLRREMGRAGRRRAEAHFGWPAIAAQTFKLYRALTAPA